MTTATDNEWHVLVQDDDGHWYVCPADKRGEAEEYFDLMADYWSPENDGSGSPPKVPLWLERVGGAPSLVRFKAYEVR